uniref:RNA binding motif protein X-linked 2 n=1 Tax=Molossus molossus TaxID=27622 RepID=A0A7J8J9Q2_MOLMO|nr:RNA binding motif protein X-linked 2 [Molossus molossus]
MNPLTKVKLINELNEREVQLGVSDEVSWHSEYKDSAWIFLGGLPYELTEGDIICVFSQTPFKTAPVAWLVWFSG